jgi:hypothetical protein
MSSSFLGVFILFRDGKVRFANWSVNQKDETLVAVAGGERLKEKSEEFRKTSSMAFSKDGMTALAINRRGKILALEFLCYRLRNSYWQRSFD